MSLIEEAKSVLKKTTKEIEEFQEDQLFDIMREAKSIFSENYMDFQNLILHAPAGCISILFKKRKMMWIVKNKSIGIKCYSAQDIAIAICIIWINTCDTDYKRTEEHELLHILLDYNKWTILATNSLTESIDETMDYCVDNIKYINNDLSNDKGRRYLIFRQKSQTTIYDIKKNQTACAKCSKNDTYDPTIGVLIAWSRLKNIHIPDVIFNIMDSDDLKHNDVFTYFGETERYVSIATVFGRKMICADGNLDCCITYSFPPMKPLTLGRKVKLIMRNGVKIC